jgi:hypothetical protein
MVPNQEDAFPVVVDTGFDGELPTSETDIHRFECEFLDLESSVEFADRERRTISVARTWIIWFGQSQMVRLWITPAETRRTAAPDEPVGLLGTALLKPRRLTADFATRRVAITENE